jgi:hypothetical protein
MYNTQASENKHNLIEKLVNFLKETDLNEPLEVKPVDEFYSIEPQKNDVEKVTKDYATELDKQLDVICQNIAIRFFELNDEKFQAIMQRIELWGYELCLEEFILNYYLIIKKDNRLRQFVLLHLPKLIKMLKDTIQVELTTKMYEFDFKNTNTSDLDNLHNQLKEKEQELLQVQPEKLAEDTAEEVVTTEKLNTIRAEILSDLREANPELETDNWM